MSPRRKRQFYAVLALMLVGAVAEIVAIGAILPFLSLIANPEGARDIPVLSSFLALIGADTRSETFLGATLLFAVAVLLAGAVRLQLAWSSQSFVFRLGHDIGVEIQRRILSQSYSYHITRNTSEVVASLEKVQILVYNVLLQLMLAGTALVISIFIVAALIWVDPITAFIAAFGFGGLYVLVSALTRGSLARNSRTIGASYAQRIQIVQESLGGIRDIIIDQSQPIYLQAFEEVDLRFSIAKSHTAFIGAAPRFVIEAAGMILIAVLAMLIAQQGGLAGALPVLGALALGAQRLLPLIQQVYYGWTSAAGNRSVVGDVLELLKLPLPSHGAEGRARPMPFEREIRLANLGFSYPGRAEPALAGIDLVIPRGGSAAFIGKTGSGKSTLVDLLMGLLEPSVGDILVDGQPLRGEVRRSWQSNIAHVPQAIFLADTTIARNIAFGTVAGEIDKERVVAAARQAQLHDFVSELPEGYETPVGERGVRLSGGQRQRLGIARALYKAAPVLILDEATSALDDETEAAVIRSLHQVESRPTVIMIAHRLSTIASCDLVVRLSEGRIVETGTYSQVVPKRRNQSR